MTLIWGGGDDDDDFSESQASDKESAASRNTSDSESVVIPYREGEGFIVEGGADEED